MGECRWLDSPLTWIMMGLAFVGTPETIAAEMERAEALSTNLTTVPQGKLKITAPMVARMVVFTWSGR